MAQTTSKRVARGWSALVSQITGATSVQDFHQRMLDLQCKIVAAEYGALWTIDAQGKPVLDQTWPEALKDSPGSDPVRAILDSAAEAATKRNTSLVMRVDQEGVNASPGLGAHLFCTMMHVHGRPAALTTVVADCRDPSVLQTTTPMRDLAAGLYEVFAARQEANYRAIEASRVRKAMAMLATSQEAQGFYGASMNLINEMARQLKCSRVSLGWVKGQTVKLVAMSDTEEVKRHSEEVALIELAMAESLDQQQPIVSPVPPDAEPMLVHAVAHAHRKLVAGENNKYVASIPLRQRDEWIGVLTFERSDEPLTNDLIQHLQLIADVVASHLWDRYDNDRWLVGHAYESFKWVMSYLVGPKHVMWKLGVIAALVCLGYLAVGTWPYKIGAPFVYEAQTKRIIPAPFDARLDQVNVRPGDPVKKGQVLARLDVRELELQLADARGRQRMAQLKKAKGRAEGKVSDAQLAQADLDQVNAQIALLEYRIGRAQIVAPLDGYVVAGTWQDKVGSMVQLGDNLFEVAPEGNMVAVLHIDESDINMIQPGETGVLSSKADPQYKIKFTIQRIVPMAGPVDNENVFEARAHLQNVDQQLLAGTEGQAYIDVGPRPIRWIATRRIMDKIHLWLWW
jgi:multidrug resistance efflux pump